MAKAQPNNRNQISRKDAILNALLGMGAIRSSRSFHDVIPIAEPDATRIKAEDRVAIRLPTESEIRDFIREVISQYAEWYAEAVEGEDEGNEKEGSG